MGIRATAVLFLGGCNLVFGVEPVPSTDALAASDAASCTPLLSNFDDFDTVRASPCSWGYLTQSSCAAVIENGVLAMTPDAAAPESVCICGTNSPLVFTSTFGTMVEVDQIGQKVGEYTQFSARDSAGSATWHIRYQPGNTALSFQRGMSSLGAVPWDPTLRWWRIRPDDAGTAVLGEVSADGKQWTQIAADAVTPPASIEMSFHEGTFLALPMPSTARLASINVCP